MWRLCFRILLSTTVGITSLLFLIFQRKLCWRAGHWIWLMKQPKGKELTCFIDQAIDLSGKKFATKEENFTGFQRVYSLVQCTPDLSPDQCDRCLIGTIAILPDCCGGKQGARVLFPSCNVRYELYPFYQSVAAPPSPPPARPSEPSTEGKLPLCNSGSSTFLFISS